jgi:hypothetical protein
MLKSASICLDAQLLNCNRQLPSTTNSYHASVAYRRSRSLDYGALAVDTAVGWFRVLAKMRCTSEAAFSPDRYVALLDLQAHQLCDPILAEISFPKVLQPC